MRKIFINLRLFLLIFLAILIIVPVSLYIFNKNSTLNSGFDNESDIKCKTTDDSSKSNVLSLPSSPIKLKLCVSSAPALSQQTNLTMSVVSEEDNPGTELKLVLPEGFVLASDTLPSTIDLLNGQEKKFTVKIKAVKTGVWNIEASAIFTASKSPLYAYGGRDEIYLQVYENEGKLGYPTEPREKYILKIKNQLKFHGL